MPRDTRHARARRWLGVLAALVAVLAGGAYATANVGQSGRRRARNPHTRLRYYVSPRGSDSNSGTSIGHPWKTVRHVNEASLHAGDAVLFQGNATFTDTYLKGNSGGTSGKPITYSTYGTGNARIRAI